MSAMKETLNKSQAKKRILSLNLTILTSKTELDGIQRSLNTNFNINFFSFFLICTCIHVFLVLKGFDIFDKINSTALIK